MIQQRSRIPAIMMLLALMAFGVGMVFARRGSANVAQQSEIKKLHDACADPDAKPETWLRLAQALQSTKDIKNYPEAVNAYDQVLKADPYQREARFGCAYCRA